MTFIFIFGIFGRTFLLSFFTVNILTADLLFRERTFSSGSLVSFDLNSELKGLNKTLDLVKDLRNFYKNFS